MRMAQTRGGKRDWMKCESSTKGCVVMLVWVVVFLVALCLISSLRKGFGSSERRGSSTHHKKSPDCVVGEDGAGDNKHCEAYETVELVGVEC